MENTALVAAYRATRYVVFPTTQEAGRVWVLGVDHAAPSALDAWLQREGFTGWSLLTAFNPGSRLLSLAENMARQARLREALRHAGWRWFPGMNYAGEDSDWPPEASFWIPGMAQEDATHLARAFAQNAFLCGTTGGKARLIHTEMNAQS